jgi:hypothetical protein
MVWGEGGELNQVPTYTTEKKFNKFNQLKSMEIEMEINLEVKRTWE